MTLCANCGQEPGTKNWGTALDATHGFTVKWCERCVLKAQIKHAEERARALPKLKARLAALNQKL